MYSCSHPYDTAARTSLRWACDGWALIDRNPELDWQLVLRLASERQLSLPLWFSLDYLERNFRLTIPPDILTDLAIEARKTTTSGFEFALAGARKGRRGGYRGLWRAASGLRDHLFIIKWILLPTPTYVQWAKGGPVEKR